MRKANYKYTIDFSKTNPIIHYDDESNSLPEYLYKYYSLNERNVNAIVSNRIYVSSSHQLNDLFDSLYLKIDVYPDQVDFYRFFVEYVGLPFDSNEFNNSQEYRQMLRNSLCAVWNLTNGIFSTTDNPTNDLMWAHYTNNEGFVVQINYRMFPKHFGAPIPVSYLSDNEFIENNYQDLREELYANALTKKNIWQYENEYRFIVISEHKNFYLTDGPFSNIEDKEYIKVSRLQEFDPDCIKKIIFGFNFFKPLRIDDKRFDFSKTSGLLRKSLIDWCIKYQVETEIISIDYRGMSLIPNKFQIKMISELEFEIV